MVKPKIIVAVDFGSKDYSTETICKVRPDGTLEILSIHQWNKELTLTKSEYKIIPL